MMSILLALALLQAPANSPPTGPVLRNGFTTRSSSLPYPGFMQPMVLDYQGCVFEEGSFPRSPGLSQEDALKHRIAYCAEVRDRAVRRSIREWGRAPGVSGDPTAQVQAIFDSQDISHLAYARFTDRLIAGEVSPPATSAVVDLPKENHADD
jgi:hypothetical protein